MITFLETVSVKFSKILNLNLKLTEYLGYYFGKEFNQKFRLLKNTLTNLKSLIVFWSSVVCIV